MDALLSEELSTVHLLIGLQVVAALLYYSPALYRITAPGLTYVALKVSKLASCFSGGVTPRNSAGQGSQQTPASSGPNPCTPTPLTQPELHRKQNGSPRVCTCLAPDPGMSPMVKAYGCEIHDRLSRKAIVKYIAGLRQDDKVSEEANLLNTLLERTRGSGENAGPTQHARKLRKSQGVIVVSSAGCDGQRVTSVLTQNRRSTSRSKSVHRRNRSRSTAKRRSTSVARGVVLERQEHRKFNDDADSPFTTPNVVRGNPQLHSSAPWTPPASVEYSKKGVEWGGEEDAWGGEEVLQSPRHATTTGGLSMDRHKSPSILRQRSSPVDPTARGYRASRSVSRWREDSKSLARSIRHSRSPSPSQYNRSSSNRTHGHSRSLLRDMLVQSLTDAAQHGPKKETDAIADARDRARAKYDNSADNYGATAAQAQQALQKLLQLYGVRTATEFQDAVLQAAKSAERGADGPMYPSLKAIESVMQQAVEQERAAVAAAQKAGESVAARTEKVLKQTHEWMAQYKRDAQKAVDDMIAAQAAAAAAEAKQRALEAEEEQKRKKLAAQTVVKPAIQPSAVAPVATNPQSAVETSTAPTAQTTSSALEEAHELVLSFESSISTLRSRLQLPAAAYELQGSPSALSELATRPKDPDALQVFMKCKKAFKFGANKREVDAAARTLLSYIHEAQEKDGGSYGSYAMYACDLIISGLINNCVQSMQPPWFERGSYAVYAAAARVAMFICVKYAPFSSRFRAFVYRLVPGTVPSQRPLSSHGFAALQGDVARAISGLYSSVLASRTQPRPYMNANPLGIDQAWLLVVRLVNSPPKPHLVSVLHSVLVMAGYELYLTYRRQFLKLCQVVHDEYVKDIPSAGDLNLVVTNLLAMLREKDTDRMSGIPPFVRAPLPSTELPEDVLNPEDEAAAGYR